MQRGGVTLSGEWIKHYGPDTKEQALEYFIRNSTMSFITITKGGILFKLTLDGSIRSSPYVINRSNYPLIEVREMLFKIILIRDDISTTNTSMMDTIPTEASTNMDTSPTEEEILSFIAFTDEIQRETLLEFVSSADFNEEVQTQIELFTKSLDVYLEPICPSIIDYKTYKDAELSMFGDLFNYIFSKYNSPICYNIIQKIRAIYEDYTRRDNRHSYGLSIICMEYLSDFNTGTFENFNDPIIKGLAFYELIRMRQLGVVHCDPHPANFMINFNYDYIKHQKGRTIVIDFGRIKRIAAAAIPADPSEWLNDIIFEICNYYIENKYTDNVPMIYTAFMRQYYGWLMELYYIKKLDSRNFTKNLQTSINSVIEYRNLAKKEFIDHLSVVPVSTGGKANQESLQLLNTYSSPPEKMQTSPYTKLVNNSSNPFRMSKSRVNMFDALDPSHIFTHEFIEKYIEDERKHADFIIKSLNKPKHVIGGRRINTRKRRNAQRKNTTRRKNTRKIKKRTRHRPRRR